MTLMPRDIRGILPATPTPVTADDKIDVTATKALYAWLLQQGVEGVVPLGGTGEYGALPRAERLRFTELTAEAMDGKGPVVAGVLDTGYYDALQSGKELAAAGADGLLVLTPYYTNPTPQGLRDYFMRYADQSAVPILIYEIPYRTRVAIPPEVLHELSRHERIIGMKACNTDMYHFLRVMAGVSDDFTVLSGEDTHFPLHLAAGAKGGILVTANLVPRAFRKVFDLAMAGRIADAVAAHRDLIPLMNAAFAETNPGPMKSVMDLIGVHAPRVLTPLDPPKAELTSSLRDALLPLLEGVEREAKRLAS